MTKNQSYTTIAVSSVAFTTLLIFTCLRMNRKKKLRKIADEGYETARDILYPGREIKRTRLHYGPVLPA